MSRRTPLYSLLLTAREVKQYREICAYVARVLDDNGPVEPNTPENAALRAAAIKLGKKIALGGLKEE